MDNDIFVIIWVKRILLSDSGFKTLRQNTIYCYKNPTIHLGYTPDDKRETKIEGAFSIEEDGKTNSWFKFETLEIYTVLEQFLTNLYNAMETDRPCYKEDLGKPLPGYMNKIVICVGHDERKIIGVDYK